MAPEERRGEAHVLVLQRRSQPSGVAVPRQLRRVQSPTRGRVAFGARALAGGTTSIASIWIEKAGSAGNDATALLGGRAMGCALATVGSGAAFAGAVGSCTTALGNGADSKFVTKTFASSTNVVGARPSVTIDTATPDNNIARYRGDNAKTTMWAGCTGTISRRLEGTARATRATPRP